jgi:uncharacterized protein (TIGR03067 family)
MNASYAHLPPIDCAAAGAYASASHHSRPTSNLMRQIFLTLASATLALLFSFEAGAKPVPKSVQNQLPKGDMVLLQGEWMVVSIEAPKNVKPNPDRHLKVNSNEWVYPNGKFDFKIDATKSPKQIDLMKELGKVWPGIFKIEGDTLTLCRSHGPGGERPTAFAGGPGIMLYVYKRSPTTK